MARKKRVVTDRNGKPLPHKADIIHHPWVLHRGKWKKALRAYIHVERRKGEAMATVLVTRATAVVRPASEVFATSAEMMKFRNEFKEGWIVDFGQVFHVKTEVNPFHDHILEYVQVLRNGSPRRFNRRNRKLYTNYGKACEVLGKQLEKDAKRSKREADRLAKKARQLLLKAQ